MSYKKVLKASQLAYVEDIVSQIPETHGARAAFEIILDELADSKPKFKYYITDTGQGVVRGTNDEQIAEDLAESEECYVVDVTDNLWVQPEGISEEVKEQGE